MTIQANPSMVFLSHSHLDREIVVQVAYVLRMCSIEAWCDEWRSQVDHSLIQQTEHSLSRANMIVLFISRHSAELPWFRQVDVLGKPLVLEAKAGTRLLPARLDDTPVPPLLRSRVPADFRQSFAVGMTRLLAAIHGASGRLDIDQVLCEGSRELAKNALAARTITATHAASLATVIRERMVHCWTGAIYSARALGKHAQMSDSDVRCLEGIGQFEKWLGNTIRDYLQFKVYHETTMRLVAQAENCITYTASDVFDDLHARLQILMKEYGLPMDRGADKVVASELRTLLRVLEMTASEDRDQPPAVMNPGLSSDT